MNQLPPAFTATIDSAIAELTKIRAGLTEQIFSEVTRLTGITRDEMCSRSRKREIIIARHGAVWLMKQNTTLTLKQIGALFGRRDHSTVLHAIDCVEDCPPLDRSFRWMANVVLVGEVQAQQSESEGIKESYLEIMDKQKLIHQLFIGKVADVLGVDKTTELLNEAFYAGV